MKYIFTIGLYLSIVCCIVSAVFADGDPWTDRENAMLEQDRLEKLITEYLRERDRYVSLADDLKGRGSGSLGSLQTILISSLSSATQTTLANTAGLTLRAFLSSYGSSSLASAVDSAISTASTYHGMATYLYTNPTRLNGYNAANSALEANMKARAATDHYNAHHSSQSINPPSEPTEPNDLNLPTFECPGPCTNQYSTVWEAINVHYEKCGTASPVSRLLNSTERLTILAGRSVSEGCGVDWYSCDSNHSSTEAIHRVRTCTKGVWATRYTDYTNGTERYRSHTCGDSFRNCMPHKDYHKSSTFKTVHSDSETDDPAGSTSPSVSKPPPPPPPPSPSYHACGVHETSVSGDHSLQASCSSTDSNGNSCTVSSFYACDGHSHVYPSPPETVSCARSACGAEVSDRLAHRVDSCSNCGNVYWTCYPNATYNHEMPFTCRRCGTSFTRCSNGTCTSGGKTYSYHWAK